MEDGGLAFACTIAGVPEDNPGGGAPVGSGPLGGGPLGGGPLGGAPLGGAPLGRGARADNPGGGPRPDMFR